MPHGGNRSFKHLPVVTCKNGERIVSNFERGCIAAYKYFDLTNTKALRLKARGKGQVRVLVDDKICGVLSFDCNSWQQQSLSFSGGKHAKISFSGERGRVELYSFTLE